MQSLWTLYRESVFATVYELNDHFEQTKAQCPVLNKFWDAVALMDWLGTHHVDLDLKDQVYRELITSARVHGSHQQLSTALILAGLWSGLDHCCNRLRRYFAQPEECASQVMGEAAQQILELNLEAVNRVAATFVRNVYREVMDGIKEGWRYSEPESIEPGVLEPQAPEEVPAEEPAVLRQIALNEIRSVVGERDTELIRLLVVEGKSAAEVGPLVSMTPNLVSQRFRRAKFKLDKVFPGFLSRLGPQSCVCHLSSTKNLGDRCNAGPKAEK